MKPIAVCDVETDPFKKFRSPQPFLAGWFDGKRTRTFWGKNCIRDCWKSMRKELRGYYIYWHNGGKFDARYFMPYLHKAKAVCKPIKGRMARFDLPDGTQFRDSYCLLPVPLKATGQKVEIDYRKFERHCREKHREEIMRYFKVDLTVPYEKVKEFVELYGFGMTMAGRTFDQLKKNFGIDPPKTNEFHDKGFRRYYYGGRVEFFRLGRCPGKYKLIDINSAYPNAMLQKHAFGLEFHATEKLPKNESVLQTCFVRFIGRSRGGLPFRGLDGSLSFLPHDGEFFVTGWEFVAARSAGAVQVREVVECLRPLECRDFSGFVNYFYKQKREAVKGSSEELFAKLFLNSAYGRFALNPREFRDVMMTDYAEEPEENEASRKKIKKYVKAKHPGIRGEAFRLLCADYWAGFDGKWERANDFEDIGVSIWERACEVRSNGFFNVATAASITGCVRAHMFESLRRVKNPVYCDTDSIICEDTGKLPLGAGLGEWKLEAESTRGGVHIAGKKLYAFELAPAYRKNGKKWKLASKGVKLTAEEIVRVARGEVVKSTLIAPTFSLFTTRSVKGSKQDFITRTVRRDDQRRKPRSL
jgi:hypothetical protein